MVSLNAESWTWYAVVVFVILSRLISRRMNLGSFARFEIDDYGIVLALCFYTTLIVTINIVAVTSSNLLPPGFDMATLSPSDIAERQYGSKLILVVEQCQIATIWLAKGCLLALYLRLTTLRRENIAIKVLAAYVVISFVVMEILYFAVWCTPFWEYWAVPTDNIQCSAATNHLITNAVFNLSSDCIMLAVGLPMFLRLHFPWQKKVPLILVFGLGIFVVLASILNKVYSFSEPFGSAWTYWYVREGSTALLVADLPFVWTLWRRAFGIRAQSEWSHTVPTPPDSAESGERKGTQDSQTNLRFDRSKRNVSGDLELSENRDSADSRHSSELSLNVILHEGRQQVCCDDNVSPITHPYLYSLRSFAGHPATKFNMPRSDFTNSLSKSHGLDIHPG